MKAKNLWETIAPWATTENIATLSLRKEQILRLLTPRQASILAMRHDFTDGSSKTTYSEIAQKHNLSRSMTKKIAMQATRELLRARQQNIMKAYAGIATDTCRPLARDATDTVPLVVTLSSPTDIDELNLSTRPRNALRDARITTVRDLLGRTRSSLLRTKGIGPRILAEITRSISSYGLKLTEAQPPRKHSAPHFSLQANTQAYACISHEDRSWCLLLLQHKQAGRIQGAILHMDQEALIMTPQMKYIDGSTTEEVIRKAQDYIREKIFKDCYICPAGIPHAETDAEG